MKTKWKKALSVLLTAVMLLGLVQIAVFAEEAYPALQLDTPYTLAISDDSYVYLTFTPETSGDYKFQSESLGDSDPDIDGMYDSEGDSLDIKYGDDDDVIALDFMAVYTLTAGETYTIEIEDIDASGDEFTVTVSKFIATISGVLSLDTPVSIDITDGLVLLYAFTPEVDGAYAFSSSCADGSNADPKISSLTDESGNELDFFAGDSDDYDGYDFMAVYELSAGVKYTVCIIDLGNTGNEFDVSVSKYYGAKKQPTEEKPAVEMYFADEVKSYQWYKIKTETFTITDQNATVLDTDHGKATYDSASGIWSVIDSGYNCYEIFETDVVAGDEYVVEVLSNEVLDDSVALIGDNCWLSATKGDDGKYYITADKTATVTLRIYTDFNHQTMTVRVTGTGKRTDDKLDTQTTDTLTAFNEGTEYACVVTYKDGTVLTTDPVAPVYTVTHQPTETEPFVETNMANGVTYQWYKVTKSETAVTDQNATLFDFDDYDDAVSPGMTVHSSKASYDSTTDKWSGAVIEIPTVVDSDAPQSYAHYFFTRKFTEGDTLTVELSGDYEMCLLGQFATSMAPVQGVKDGGKVVFTIPADGEYSFAASSSSKSLTASAYVEEITDVKKLEGQTSEKLTQLERGLAYYCDVTFNGEDTVATVMFDVNGSITHQPTAKEPYVEVTYPDEVKGYQWYEVEDNTELITDEDVEAYESGSKIAEFDSATGEWTGAVFPLGGGEYGFVYFLIDLKAGDVLTVEVSDEPAQIYLYDVDTHDEAEYTVNGNTITFEVSKDGYYQLDIMTMSADSTIKAYLGAFKLDTKLDGQTASELTAAEKDRMYACAVTYEDGAELVSDRFTADEDTVKYTEDIKKHENAAAVEDKINAIPEIISKADKDIIEAAQKAYDALTDDEKALVSSELVTKLDTAVKTLAELVAVSPDTGDNGHAGMWVVVLLLSAVSLLGVMTSRVKRKA